MENISDKDYHFIERFFEMELTEAELLAFNQRLKTDTFFEKQVAQYEFALRTVTQIYMPEQATLKKELSQHWQNPSNKIRQLNSKKSIWKRGAAIAASLLLLLGIGWLMQSTDRSQDVNQLLAQKTDKLESFNQENRGDTLSFETLLAYKKEAYQSVIAMTDNAKNLSFEKKLLRARAFIKTQQYHLAIPILKSLYQEKSAKQDEIIWNLVYAHFAIGELPMAKVYLEQINSGKFGKHNQTEANKILKLMNL